jgi:radical SAM protein with 4Fe4S-binding SPASM domain
MDTRPQSSAQPTRIPRPERTRIEQRNRALLERELLAHEVVFESRPYEAHVQFSNFCNMSCVMCWDGENPPLERMSPEILAKVAEQVAPHLSLITPHGGSEPLALTWDETRGLCSEWGVDLCLTTNVQFLDEQKFRELREITETLALSVDSHIPELFAKIRPNSRPDEVFENLATTARLARETGLECVAQMVFLTQNAPTLPETVAYMGDIGIEKINIIQMIDVNGRSGFSDPLLHFSADYVDHLRKACIKAAEEKRLYIRWLDREWYDFRTEKIPTPARERWNDAWDYRMRHIVPGYCKYAYNRLQISAAGVVTPCAYAADGELEMGSLAEQDFDEIWNGPTARDLRRSMMTWDYTSLCNTCRFSDKLAPGTDMRFVDRLPAMVERPLAGMHETLEVLLPEHMTRHEAPPSIQVAKPAEEIDFYYLAWALGAEQENAEVAELCVSADAEEHVDLSFPPDVWDRMRTNLGYWWAVVAVTATEHPIGLRPSTTRCMIRHERMERIEGSTLRYPDEGNLPVVDLGGAKQAGWQNGILPARPQIREYRRKLASQRDLSHHKKLAIQGENPYPHMVARIRRLAASALPKGATVLVASKGDDELLKLGDVEAWHFLRAEDASYLGHHPENSEAAIEALERLRSAGADHLLLPATSMWWLEYYDGLAEHLDMHYAVAAEDTESCVIFALAGR